MQVRSDKTISKIMNAAIKLFSHSGYDAASVADICKEAGVSKGAFYHHFPSKQSLFLEIVNQWLHGLDEHLFTAHSSENVPQTILRIAGSLGLIFQQAKGQLPMYFEFMVQASRDQAVWDAAIAPFHYYQSHIAQLLEQGKAEGSIRAEVDAATAARVLISLAVGTLLQSVVDSNAADWGQVAEGGIRMIVDSIKKE